MPFTAARAATVTAALNDSFLGIGKTTADTKMPRWMGDQDKLPPAIAAWEYHVASHLLRKAETRRNAAIKGAIASGVLFDHKAHPLASGTSKVVYGDLNLEVTVKVSEGTKGCNHEAFVDDLLKAGVDPKLIARLGKKHETHTAAPHKFNSALVTK